MKELLGRYSLLLNGESLLNKPLHESRQSRVAKNTFEIVVILGRSVRMPMASLAFTECGETVQLHTFKSAG